MARALFDHIQLQGSAAFIARTEAALTALRTTNCCSEVWGLLAVVRKGKRSGVSAHKYPPVIEVGRRIWNSPTIWYASGIAHEGFHIKLHREAKKENEGDPPELTTWAGIEAEKKCLGFQLCVLQELKAKDYMLEYIRELIKSPKYPVDPSSFQEYMSRNW